MPLGLEGERRAAGSGDGRGRLWTAHLRTRECDFRLCAKQIAVQICNPLAAAWGKVEVADRSLDVRIHAFPKELWVRANHICRGSMSELSIQARFLKLVVERICLGDVVRIPRVGQCSRQRVPGGLPHHLRPLLARS